MTSCVRIANGQGFWGDSVDAPAALLRQQPDLEYLTLDYLAEVSMSIMALQRERNPELGYARDFVDVVRSLTPLWADGATARVIANAGGLDPMGCAETCARVMREAGLRGRRIGVVHGDDVLSMLQTEADDPVYRHLEDGRPITDVADRLTAANAYTGCAPIVAALADGADMVITGRTADPCLVAAPALHHFGWRIDDYDRIAGALMAGHVIECGVQATGGISTRWLDVPDAVNMGYPYVELLDDGSFIVTKPAGTGGRVTCETVKEQILYEMGDPGAFLTPDATVSILGLTVAPDGDDRVRVAGAAGTAPTDCYKVSATYRDGWRASGMVTIFGRDAVAKAKRCGAIVIERVAKAGYELDRVNIECLGANACAPDMLPEPDVLETVLRISVADARREAVDRFAKELMPLVTSGPQGTTGYAGGRPRATPVFGYWPCLIPKDRIAMAVDIVEV